MKLEDFGIYQRCRELSREAWTTYSSFDTQTRRAIGTQWITAVDSVGANIAEGFGRYHFADRNKFNYNARGSLMEAIHWTELLRERKLLKSESHSILSEGLAVVLRGLNSYIKATKSQTER